MRFNFRYAKAGTQEVPTRRAYAVLDALESIYRQVLERLLLPA